VPKATPISTLQESNLAHANGAAHQKLPKVLLDSIKTLNKNMGAGTIMVGDNPIVTVDTIPTDIASLDLAMGVGGLPRGRMIELFGVESSGKTTTALQMVAACQQRRFPATGTGRHGIAAFIDAEHSLDLVWARNLGVNVSTLLLNQPDSGEAAFMVLEALVKSGSVDLVVIDSLASLVPKEELDGDIDDNQIGAQARMISKALRRLKGPINTSKTAVVFINQIRTKVGQMFGNPESTPGGLALKFYASIRIDMRKGAAIREGKPGGGDDESKSMMGAIGMRTRVKVIKNKVARPFRSCEYDIYFNTAPVAGADPISGVDTLGSLFDVAYTEGLIDLSGSNYYHGVGGKKQLLGVGKVKAINSLRGNNVLRQQLLGALLERYRPTADARTMDHDDLVNSLSAEELDQMADSLPAADVDGTGDEDQEDDSGG